MYMYVFMYVCMYIKNKIKLTTKPALLKDSVLDQNTKNHRLVPSH